MSELEYSAILDMAEEDLDAYIEVSLSNANRVSPSDRKKLKGLMRFYAKKKHPFTACVNDNTKRFGKERAERICAVLKDLIRGTTKWRGKEHMSESEQKALALNIEDIDCEYMVELAEEELLDSEFPELAEDQKHLLAEMYFSDGGQEVGDDGFIWKTVLREGEWKFSPGAGQVPTARPIQVVKDGESSYDKDRITVSMSDLIANFRDGAVEHVTIPSSHADRVLENTGFIRDLRLEQDEEGRWVLKAAHDFTEPDVKDKALRGTIANTSAGLIFDYLKKEVGKTYKAVLGHVALTNKPWLNGMKPFGVHASEDGIAILGFSEEPTDPAEDAGGGDNMSDKDKTGEEETPKPITLSEAAQALGFADEAEFQSFKDETERMRTETRERGVKDKIKKWEGDKKAPALLVAAEKIMMSEKAESSVVNLSEGSKTEELSLSEVVERLVDASPSIALAGDDPTSDEDNTGDKPDGEGAEENEFANLSEDEKTEVNALFFSGKSMKDALAEVKNKKDKGGDR